jgi:beta-glucuronidase
MLNQPEQEFHAHRVENEEFDEVFNNRALDHRGMIFMGGRRVRSLDGNWGFLTDQYDSVMRRAWYRLGTVDTATRRRPWEFDFDCRSTMPVPGCWNTHDRELAWYEGTTWYFRRLDEAPGEDRVFLRFGAANYDAKVFFNREFIGNHYGGSTPFFVEITDRLTGDDEILVAVNNERSPTRVPMRNTDWYNYGGIHRSVEIVRVPQTFIRDVYARLLPDGRTIAVDVTVEGAADSVQVEIPDLGIAERVALADGKGRLDVAAEPVPWCPETPRLYDLAVTCGQDRVTDRVGFRTVAVEGTQVLLNGAPVFLRGISVHEDDVLFGRVTSEEDIRRRFRHAREMNCNFVRLAHYPHHELAARIADEEGILLWEEVPVYWAIAFDNEDTFADAQNQLIELIKRDRNRASVIMWSVGNENEDADPRLSFMARLAATCREWDPSRLVTAAVLVNRTTLKVEDRLADHLDVLGLNEYYGWYNADWDEFERLILGSAPDKPVVISEFGAGALAGRRGREDEPFTEDHQDMIYRRQIEVLSQAPYIVGMTPWILYDFRAPRRQNRFQRGYNRKGLIHEDKRTKKLAFHRMARFYAQRAEGKTE